MIRPKSILSRGIWGVPSGRMSPWQHTASYMFLFFPFTNNTCKALERWGRKSDGKKELDIVEWKSAKSHFLNKYTMSCWRCLLVSSKKLELTTSSIDPGNFLLSEFRKGCNDNRGDSTECGTSTLRGIGVLVVVLQNSCFTGHSSKQLMLNASSASLKLSNFTFRKRRTLSLQAFPEKQEWPTGFLLIFVIGGNKVTWTHAGGVGAA